MAKFDPWVAAKDALGQLKQAAPSVIDVLFNALKDKDKDNMSAEPLRVC